MTEGPIVKEPTPEEDRVRPLPLVGVALGSLVVGFLLVYALGQSAADAPDGRRRPAPGRIQPEPAARPAGQAPRPEAQPEPEAAAGTGTAARTGTEAAAGTEAGTGTGTQAGTGTGTQAGAAAAPGPATAGAATTARGSWVGEAFYFRCWEAGHDEPAAEGTCDRLPELERRIAAQLAELEACASGATGTLSLGVEVQLRAQQASYWAGRRSTITPVEPLIRCARARLEDTDLDGLEGRFRKYTLFVPIELR